MFRGALRSDVVDQSSRQSSGDPRRSFSPDGEATHIAIGIAAALLGHNRSVRGSIAAVSMRCLELFVKPGMVQNTFPGTITERRGSNASITAVSGALPCKDGR